MNKMYARNIYKVFIPLVLAAATACGCSNAKPSVEQSNPIVESYQPKIPESVDLARMVRASPTDKEINSGNIEDFLKSGRTRNAPYDYYSKFLKGKYVSLTVIFRDFYPYGNEGSEDMILISLIISKNKDEHQYLAAVDRGLDGFGNNLRYNEALVMPKSAYGTEFDFSEETKGSEIYTSSIPHDKLKEANEINYDLVTKARASIINKNTSSFDGLVRKIQNTK